MMEDFSSQEGIVPNLITKHFVDIISTFVRHKYSGYRQQSDKEMQYMVIFVFWGMIFMLAFYDLL